MKKENNKIDKRTTEIKERKSITQDQKKEKVADKNFPGYPHYPKSEDIYSQEEKVDLNPEDLSKNKTHEEFGKRNIKGFLEDLTGEDLDVPGSKADEAEDNAGNEDEENNYYSLGGDNHNDLEEDKGD